MSPAYVIAVAAVCAVLIAIVLAALSPIGSGRHSRPRECGRCLRFEDIPCICGEPCLSPDCPARERRAPG